MKSLEDSVVTALDGSEPEIYPYIPYILQDLWEIGSSPGTITELIKKHKKLTSGLNILDLGCGKGAVSVRIAKDLQCRCFGIDAVLEFIEFANFKSKELGVDSLCRFETADIRIKVNELTDFDIVILGSIGPVLGNYYQTLTSISNCIKEDGLIIIDDGYIDNDDNIAHPHVLKKDEMIKQISEAGMQIKDELVFSMDEKEPSNHYILERLTQRCKELIEMHPENRNLFENYIRKQEYETELLETKIISSTLVIRKRFIGRREKAP